jgi:hypothetical protein
VQFSAKTGVCIMQLQYSGLKPSDALLADKRAYHALLRGEGPAVSKKRS